MKKILLSAILALSLMSFSPTETIKSDNKTSVRKAAPVACNYGQCQATAKSTGNQCKHCVSKKGDSYCYQHK